MVAENVTVSPARTLATGPPFADTATVAWMPFRRDAYSGTRT
jgi:hypothetical protein